MADDIVWFSPETGDLIKSGDSGKVKLKEMNSKFSESLSRVVVFHTSPDIVESQQVVYKSFDPIHAPGSILSYVNTPSRTFSVSNLKFVSRNGKEATINLAKVHTLRAWTKSVFGKFTDASGVVSNANNSAFNLDSKDTLGLPPRVLEFSAYSPAGKGSVGNINKVPTVITNLTINYSSDVDYIPTATVKGLEYISPNIPFPVIMNVEIALTEIHSPVQYRNFSIADYRKGTMVGF